MKMHLRGRLLIECSVVRGHLDGTDPEPSEDDDRDKKTIREWYFVDNRIMAIIGQSVVPSIRLQLGKFTSAKEMWDFLSGMYVQSSHAREYQLTLSQYTLRGLGSRVGRVTLHSSGRADHSGVLLGHVYPLGATLCHGAVVSY
jgi:hypothetical protein